MSDTGRRLGRGLSALLADSDLAADAASAPETTTLPIDRIAANPDQPRRVFDEAAMDGLASSIRERGVLQPIIVRPKGRGYQIVAGERRWRAAQRAGLHEIPALVRDLDDAAVLEIAIVENVQRADLDPIEEGMGYRQLIESFGYTQERLASGLGKSRSHIANTMRLLQLPEPVMRMVQDGALTAGHARALITATDPEDLARRVAAGGLSVRETERLAKERTAPTRPNTPPEASGAKPADTVALENDLSAHLRMRVTIDHDEASGRGRMTIRYGDLERLDDLCRHLTRDL